LRFTFYAVWLRPKAALRITASGTTFAQAGDLVLYDGEPGSAPLPDPSCTEYAADTTEASCSGTHSLRLNPDPWHKPALRLYCAGQPRRNLSGYDIIEFHMRAADPANPPASPLPGHDLARHFEHRPRPGLH
ncbi:MAG: hypothetical protein ACE5LU_25655, partial [Anaerolineae bacterium]